ncbi:MAG TPA: hypothetical protein O0X42_01505 [Methanocorpusculum sp.]|nr:hypothetical protein [Methanocorpusculum sp.]
MNANTKHIYLKTSFDKMMTLRTRKISRDGQKSVLHTAGIAAAVLLLLAIFIGSGAAVEMVSDTAWYAPNQNTYTINTAEELAGLAAIVNGDAEGIAADSFEGKTVLLGSDIEINPVEKIKANANTLKVWVPLGDSVDTMFKGTFDGQGHVITGLYGVTNGLIYYGEDCTVKDVTITDSSLVTDNYLASMVCGAALGDCTFTNCHVKNSVIESNSKSTGDIGAIAGEVVRGTLTGCTVSDTDVICRNCDYTGGLVGYIDDVTSFTDCKVKNVIVVCAKSGVGGIAGYAFTDVSFTGCAAESSYIQTVYDNYAGGILGFGGAEVSLNGCTVSDSVVKAYKHSVGGVVGYAYHADFNGKATVVKDTIVNAEAEEYVGGFVGSANKPVTVSAAGCAVTNAAISGAIETTSENMGVIIGRGKMAGISKKVTVTNTILANKANPAQTDKDSFNQAGTAGNENGWIISMNNPETVDGVMYGTSEKNFDVPLFESDLTTKSTESPFPVLAVLAGLGAAAVFIRRRS